METADRQLVSTTPRFGKIELTEQLYNDIRAAFHLFDTTQSGKVDIANLGTVRSLNLHAL